MSSMLKKTGGLSFKPKAAPRRPGAAAAAAASSSQAPPTSVSTSTTHTPTTEASSQASSPAPVVPLPIPSVESSGGVGETRGKTPKETPRETSHGDIERPSVQAHRVPTVRPITGPTTTSAISSVVADKPSHQASPAPSPAPSERISQPTPAPAVSEPARQSSSAPILPTTERTAQPTPAPEVPPSSSPQNIYPGRSTPSTSSTTPAIVTSRTGIVGNAPTPTPTPDPTRPPQNRNAPPTAPPSPAPVSDTIAVSAPIEEPSASAPKKKRAYRKRKSTATDNDGGAESSAPKKRRSRKSATSEGNDVLEGGTPPVKKRYKRRARSPTPDESEEDPETQTVDHSSMKMSELTKDLGIGKRFKHADAIEERAREARERFRLKQLAKRTRAQGLALEEDPASRRGTPAGDEENGRETAAARARHLGASIGANAQQSVGYEVVDGQIIVNQQSLVVDRHAAHRDMSTLETVEEDEFSHLTTSSSYRRESRRAGANHWTDEDTEKFYRLLGMFGTDFETISAMFPEKSRRAVKLKFNREERLRPRYVNATVMVRGEKKTNIDLDEYKAHQMEWQESDKIMAEHDKLVKEHNEDIRRLKEERRAAGLLDDDEEQQQARQANGVETRQENTPDSDAGADGDDSVDIDVEGSPANVEGAAEVAVEA